MPYKDPKSDEALASQHRAHKKHYDANRQYFVDKAARRRADLKEKVRELKAAPCTDCGVQYPHYVMQFDHIGDDKVAMVSALVNTGSLKKIMAEVAKCELVCANCHAVRTHNRTSGAIGATL